jgi:hypothetical protein
MAVKLITKERIERAMTRTDHARLSDKDVRALRRLQAEIESSVAYLSEACDAVDSRIAHRKPKTVEATSRPDDAYDQPVRRTAEEELANQIREPQSFIRPVKVDSKPHG